jgi:hypothetical protein
MLLSYDDLKAWTEIKQPAAMVRWLERQGIRYTRDSRGRPVTTQRQVDDAFERKTYSASPDWSAVPCRSRRKSASSTGATTT